MTDPELEQQPVPVTLTVNQSRVGQPNNYHDSTTAATAAHSPKACSPGAYYTVIVCGCYCLPRSQPLTVNMLDIEWSREERNAS